MPTPWTTPHTWQSQEQVTKTLLDVNIRDQALAVGEHVLAQYEATAAVATVDIVQLPGAPAYAHLRLLYQGRGDSTAVNNGVLMQLSTDSSTAPVFNSTTHYFWQSGVFQGSNATASALFSATAAFIGYSAGATAPANYGGHGEVLFLNNGGSGLRSFQSQFGVLIDNTTAGQIAGVVRGAFANTGTIRAVRLLAAAGNVFSSGAMVSVIGVRSTSTST